MKLSPRVKLLLLASLFLLPIVASTLVYLYWRPTGPTSNYGELLKPELLPEVPLMATDMKEFTFRDLRGKWVMIATGSGRCGTPCLQELLTLQQVRLALGRNAQRVERVFIVDDGRLGHEYATAFVGMHVVAIPAGVPHLGPFGDRTHIYLVDPNGNVMMRWPAAPDGQRMIKDLERLLRASQIG
jgi:cytochrome oxidase Cu insertion factor (SCO1/SenC/PrrC family)